MEWNARILVLPFVTFWSIPRGSNAYSITSSTYKRDPTHHFCHYRNACFKGIHDWTTYVGCASSLIMPNPSGRIESKFASDYPFRMCSVFIVLFEIEILALSRLVGYTVFANKCSIVIYRCMYILFHWFLFLLYMRVRVAVPFGCLCLHVIRENEFPAKRKKKHIEDHCVKQSNWFPFPLMVDYGRQESIIPYCPQRPEFHTPTPPHTTSYSLFVWYSRLVFLIRARFEGLSCGISAVLSYPPNDDRQGTQFFVKLTECSNVGWGSLVEQKAGCTDSPKGQWWPRSRVT